VVFSVSATLVARYRLDELRRFAAALGSASGLAQAQSLALASHLLWFDASGAGSFGIETLPRWLEGIETGRFDPSTLGNVVTERSALAILDGKNGLSPLVLARAGEIAVAQSRDAGVGLVRVSNVGPIESAAAVTAGMALGPIASFVVGPGGAWSAALPSAEGLPVVLDQGLASQHGSELPARAHRARSRKDAGAGLPEPLRAFAAWCEVIAPAGSWLVAALCVTAIEPLTSFHARVAALIDGPDEEPWRLLPSVWDGHRREAQNRGIIVSDSGWKHLEHWGRRLAVEIPGPCES
jgi:LDH2 family malate/lactate/ureidoglycolate dehydrogenase